MGFLEKLKKKFARSPFFQNVMKMMTGTILGQVFSVAMVPIVSRIYGAEAYGDLAVFASAASIFASFFGFGLAAAIMVEKTDEEAMQTYKLSVIFTDVIVVFCSVIFLFLSPFFHIVKTSFPYPITIALLAFSVISTNQINMLYSWLNRKGRYNVLLFNPMISSFLNSGIAIILGLLGYTSFGLYAGIIFSQLMTLVHMLINMDKISYRFNFHDAKKIIVRNKDFLFYQYPASLMNNVAGNMPVLILSYCFGNTIVGYFSMSMKLLSIPSNIISSSVNRVYYKEASDRQRNGGNARKYTFQISKKLTAIYSIPMAGIILFGSWLVPFFLGESWGPSIIYLKIMAISYLFSIGVICTAGFSSVIGKQKINMLFSLIKLVVFPIVLFIVGTISTNSIVTIFSYSAFFSLINVLFYEVLFKEDLSLKGKYSKMAGVLLIASGVVWGLSELLSLLLNG